MEEELWNTSIYLLVETHFFFKSLSSLPPPSLLYFTLCYLFPPHRMMMLILFVYQWVWVWLQWVDSVLVRHLSLITKDYQVWNDAIMLIDIQFNWEHLMSHQIISNSMFQNWGHIQFAIVSVHGMATCMFVCEKLKFWRNWTLHLWLKFLSISMSTICSCFWGSFCYLLTLFTLYCLRLAKIEIFLDNIFLNTAWCNIFCSDMHVLFFRCWILFQCFLATVPCYSWFRGTQRNEGFSRNV